MEKGQQKAYDEEIDLFEYWLIVKKRKRLIVGMMVMGMILGVAVSLMVKRVYLVDGVLRLGNLSTKIDGTPIKIAGIGDIRQVIEAGGIERMIVSALELDPRKYSWLGQKIAIKANQDSEMVNLLFETDDPEVGVKILAHIFSKLETTFNDRAERLRQAKETEIADLHITIDMLETERQRLGLEVQKLEAQIDRKEKHCRMVVQGLKREIEEEEKLVEIDLEVNEKLKESLQEQVRLAKEKIQVLNKSIDKTHDMLSLFEINTQKLLSDREEILSSQNEWTSQPIMSILFSNHLQQNISYINTDFARLKEYEIELQDCHIEIDKLNASIATLEGKTNERKIKSDTRIKTLQEDVEKIINETQADVRSMKLEIDVITLKKEQEIPQEIERIRQQAEILAVELANIEGVEVVSQPERSAVPIRPSRKKIVVMITGISFFFGIFFAFLTEWNQKNEALRQIREEEHRTSEKMRKISA